MTGRGVEPRRVRYSYYTAGSGGAGPTIMETTFLLAGQPVEVFADGRKVLQWPICPSYLPVPSSHVPSPLSYVKIVVCRRQ